MPGVTFPQLKQCADIVQQHFNLSYNDAVNIIGSYKAEYTAIMRILSNDLSDIPRAAASVGVALPGADGPQASADNSDDITSRKASAGGSGLSLDNIRDKTPGKKIVKKSAVNTTKKTSKTKKTAARSAGGSAVKDHIKDNKTKKTSLKPSADISATLTRSAALSAVDSDIIPTIDGDIINNSDIHGLPAGLPDMIAAALDAFTNKYNLDLTKARQQQWAAACSFVGQNVFKTNKSILADTPPKNGGFRYDLNKIYLMVGIWSDYCSLYSKVPLITDFCLFVGIEKSTLYAASEKYTQADKLTPARVQLLKKLHDLQESGLAGAIVDGRQNPTGALAALNHWHGWTKTTEIIHTTAAAGPVAPALPVFDTESGLLSDNNGL